MSLSEIRILVVDDDPDILGATAHLLEKMGHAVDKAADGKEAMRLVQDHQPDLVLLDRDLPDMSGLEVCRRIKMIRTRAEIFVIIVSGSCIENEQQSEGFESGADDYITRPIANRELLTRVGAFARIILMARTLDQQAQELEATNAAALQSENASLNVMEDALEARDRAEKASQALQASHERFELANRATFNVIWDWDILTGDFWRNDHFRRLFGYSKEEVETNFDSATNRIHPDDLESVKAGLEIALQGRNEFWADQYRFRRKDGSYAFIEDRAVITRDGSGRAIRMLGAMQDVSERIQSEAALRESENKLRMIIEHSAQLFYSRTPDNVITYVSPQVIEFFDAGPEDTDQPWTNFLTDNSVNAIGMELTRKAIETGDSQRPYELELLTLRGRIIWVEVHESPVVENGKTIAMVGALTDITETKRTRDQLLLHGSALKAASNAIIITDRKGLIQWINPAYTTLTGYSATEAIGYRPGDLVKSGTHDQAFYVGMWATLNAGQVWKGEMTNRRKDGSLYTGEKIITPLKDEQGKITNFTSVEQDITARKQSEASLRLQSGALEAATNAIVITDREGVIQWANPAFTAFTGYGVAEAIGKRPGDLLKSGRQDAAFYKYMWDTILAGEVWMGEITNKRKDGSLYIEEMTITPLLDDQGEIAHFVAVKQDITERKQAEQKLSNLNRSLKMLSACDESLVRADNEQALLETICQIAVEIGGYHMAWVGYAQEDADHSILPMAHAGAEQGYLSEITLTWSELESSGMGPAGQAIRSGRASLFSDISLDPTSFLWLEAAGRRGFRGVIALPLRDKVHTFGILSLYCNEVLNLAEEEIGRLQEMADDLAFGISNLRAQAEGKRVQQAVVKMAQGVSGGVNAAIGEALFDLRVSSLIEALGAGGGFIGCLSEDAPGSLRTTSFIVNQQKLKNFTYDLGGTPCELVVAGETCIYERDIQTLFPQDQIAVDFGVQAYAGAPLIDSKGRMLGLIAVFFDTPIRNTELVQSTLSIFATRVTGELERQDTDARLREQASLLDKAQDAILVRDLSNQILFWNKGAENLYGWTADEMMGHMLLDLIYDDLEEFDEAQKAVLQDGEWNGQIQQWRKDGNLITVEGHWTLVRDEAGQPQSVLAINTDITERVETDRELDQYTKRLEAMREIDAALLGGRSTTELAQSALTQLRRIVPFERAALVMFDHALTEGIILALDQDQPWLPMAGAIMPIQDFHDLKHLLSAPFLDLPDLRDLQGCIMEELLHSQGLRNLVYIPMESEGAMLGFVALSATTPGVLTLKHTEIALDMTDQLVLAIQHTRMREELERSNLELESRVDKRTEELRTTMGIMQVLEKELTQREAEARAASAAKSIFLASMSHELRTPLIGVTGMLEILTQSELDTQQRHTVSVIRESSQSLLQIIGDILDFSKIEAGMLELSPHTFSARALVDSVSQIFRSACSAKGLNFLIAVDPDIAPAHVADALRIRQVLNNLMSNAVKFTERGAITLRLRRVAALDGHEALAFEVQDTGIGVSPENQAKLFEAFTQAESSTTRRFGGTGLGLVISKHMAELMGGSLTMQSNTWSGTTMTLTLDLFVGRVEDIKLEEVLSDVPTRPAPSIEAAVQEHSLILMAEDHPINRLVLTQQVNRAGYALEVAEDGQEAFEKWQSGRYAVILTDLHMPRMDGYELTQAVRDWERTHELLRTPILALTANAMDGEAEHCFDLGMDDYLIKPVTILLLASKLHEWMPHVKLGEAVVAPVASLTSLTTITPSATTTTFAPGVDSKILLDLCGGDPAEAQAILNDFIASTKADLVVLQDAFIQKDKAFVMRQAHRIKGSAAMIGARDLADCAKNLEATAKRESAEWETLQEQCTAIHEALKDLGAVTK